MMYTAQICDIYEAGRHTLSDVLPSEWAMQHMRVTEGKFQGPLDYSRTPYSVDIVNCMSPNHPANNVVVMGGSQWGKTRSVIEPVLAYYISEHPCNMGYMTGHTDLSDEAMQKLDTAIDNTLVNGESLRHRIRNMSLRKKNQRTGDTARKKEFDGGSLVSLSATNHKLLRQYNFKLVIADDIEAAKKMSKESGDTVAMITHRTASYGRDKKILWVSTPELEQTSIIKKLFLKGDQRYWFIPCQECGVYIKLEWSVNIPGSKEKAGIWWKEDEHTGKLVRSSVCYVCPECGKSFTERNKRQFLLDGFWKPTAEPFDETWVSFHQSTLYSMAGMNDWATYVQQYLEANPKGKPQVEELYKPFVNLVLGLTYEPVNEAPKASAIMGNRRNYAPWEVPNRLSVSDGNGNIILLVCSADMNGVEDDARLDWAIYGYAESGAVYAIAHGSIGTFVPRENTLKEKVDRERWTYEHNKHNSVWGELDRIISTVFKTDDTEPRPMQVFMTGLDTGKHTKLAYDYIDRTNNYVVALKGDGEDKYLKYGLNVKWFKKGLERANLYILQVGLYKDHVADCMDLKWTPSEPIQPPGFMNFPTSEGGLYQWDNFYVHFESEHRTIVADSKGNMLFRWVKLNANSQNHQWDNFVYNLAVKDIILSVVGAEYKIKDFSWRDFVAVMTS